MFYALIGSRRLWVRRWSVPLLLIGAVLALPPTVGSAQVIPSLVRFLTQDIVPAPLRAGLDGGSLSALWAWFRPILTGQILPGAGADADPLPDRPGGHRAWRPRPVSPDRAALRRPVGRPFGRVLLVVVRATPDYMLAYVFLQLLGPSMLPAILALSLHNAGIVGTLMGRHADAIPYRADAPRGLNLYAYETLPRLYGQFLALLLYRWELILRESAIFGILGVTTLGFYVDAAISELRLDVAVVLIVPPPS